MSRRDLEEAALSACIGATQPEALRFLNRVPPAVFGDDLRPLFALLRKCARSGEWRSRKLAQAIHAASLSRTTCQVLGAQRVSLEFATKWLLAIHSARLRAEKANRELARAVRALQGLEEGLWLEE